MKKIFLLVFVLISINVFGQFPINATTGTNTSGVLTRGRASIDSFLQINTTCFTDTVSANRGRIEEIGGGLIRTCDNTIWLRNNTATQWIQLGGASSLTSVFYTYGQSTDSLWVVINGDTTLLNVIDAPCGLISPGTVFWDSLLVFHASPAIYRLCCDGIRRTSDNTFITLPAAHATLNKFVAIILDSNGLNYVEGTPAASAAEPQLDDCQLLLTMVYVPAASTTPGNGSNGCGLPATETIYDQNTGAPEWTPSAAIVSVNFSNTTNPYHFTIAADVGAFSTFGSAFSFTRSSTINIAQYSSVTLFIRLKSNFNANTYIGARFLNSTTAQGSTTAFIQGGTYNFVRTTTGSYQTITIPMSAFVNGALTTIIDKLTFFLYGSNAQGFYIDYIQIQEGVCQPPSTGGLTGIAAGNLSPLFTTTVTSANPQIPTINFSLTTASGGTVFGNTSASTASPSYTANPVLGRTGLTGTLGLRGTTSGEITIQPQSAAGTYNFNLPTTAGTATYLLTSQGGAGTAMTWTDPSTIGSFTVNNGLVKNSSGVVGLDSNGVNIFTRNAIINTDAFTFNVTGTKNGAADIFTVTNAGNGRAALFTNNSASNATIIAENTNSGPAISGLADNGGRAFNGTMTDGVANTVLEGMQLMRTTSITATSGIGVSNTYVLESGGGGTVTANTLTSKLTTVTAGSEVSQFIISGLNAGSTVDKLYIGGAATQINATRFETYQGAAVIAANDLTLGTDGNLFSITGNTQINAITTTNWQAGSQIAFIFTGTPTLKNNTAGGAGTAPMLLAGRVDFVAAAGDYIGLQYDGTNWYETNRKLAASGPAYTASEGLHMAGTDVRLGGTLTKDTIIAMSTFKLTLNSSQSNTGEYALNVSNSTGGGSIGATNVGLGNAIAGQTTTGTGILGSATTGNGVNATASSTGLALRQRKSTATTNAQIEIQRIIAGTDGTGAIGLGGYIGLQIEDELSSDRAAARLGWEWTTVSGASSVGDVTISTANAGTPTEKLRVTGNGRSIFTGRILPTQGADVASVAGAIAVGLDGNVFELTGTNAVTLISNLNWQNGSEITFVFTSTATLTDGTANSGTDIGMELAGGANFVGSADDVITLVLTEMGGTQRWREKSRSVN